MSQSTNRRRLRCRRCHAEVVTTAEGWLRCPVHGGSEMEYLSREQLLDLEKLKRQHDLFEVKEGDVR